MSGLPTYVLDCSSTGQGLLTGDAITAKKMKGQQDIKAKIELVVSLLNTYLIKISYSRI